MPPVPRGCSEKRLLALKCEWKGCEKTLALPVSSYQDFAEHVFGHISGYVGSIGLSEHDIANRSSSSEDGAVLSLMTPLACCWSQCHWEVRGNPDEFSRHVMFHSYHAKLKCLGAFAVISDGMQQCSFDVDTQNLLPDVSEPFMCRWESCSIQFLCPDKFYRHVDMHAHAAHREDVLVTTGERMVTEGLGTDDKEIEGLQVQRMTQSVCRWEGCSYLARDPWKVKEHCRIHTGERLVACPGCGLFFANKTKLADHLIRQDATLYVNYQCSHCLKRCASERLLRDHMRHHVNHVKCPHCEMTCPNPSSLRSHLKFRHSIDRPFKCSMCTFSCKTKYDLARHEDIHFDKRIQCSFEGCAVECKSAASLRGHIRTVHERNGTQKFMCHICAKKLSRGFLLTKHLKKEHHFSWPSGHSRFRYKLDEDGFYRLQMVRFESAELTEQLSGENTGIETFDGNLESNEIIPEKESPVNVNNSTEQVSIEHNKIIANVSTNRSNIPQDVSTANEDGDAVVVSLNDRYEALLRYYEMSKDNESTVVHPTVENEDDLSGPKRLETSDDSLEKVTRSEKHCVGNLNKRKMTVAKKSLPKKMKTTP